MKRRVLIIDDEEVIRDLLMDVIEEAGHEPVCAENGNVGLNLYKNNPAEFGLVILDIILPGMDGKEVFYKIKEINSEAKIMIISGFSKSEVMDELFISGIAGYIAKPFSIPELNDMMKKLL